MAEENTQVEDSIESEMKEVIFLPTEEMTREEALAILKLDSSANAYKIENRYWQLSKRYRSEEDPEAMAKATLAYEVLTGKLQIKKEEEALNQKGKKFLGKNKRQWQVHFYYSWWKYVLSLVVLVIVITLGQQMLFGGRYDVRIVAAGHFQLNNEALTDFLKVKQGYTNPYIAGADLVADGSQADNSVSTYGAAAFAAYLTSNPELLIFDGSTIPFYLGAVQPMDDYYEQLKTTLPPELLAKIIPIRLTMADYIRRTTLPDETAEISPDDEVEHIYGLKIVDGEWILALGFLSSWPDRQPSLVFSIPASSSDNTRSEAILTDLLLNKAFFMERLETVSSAP